MNLLNIEWPKEPELKVSLRPCISVCGEILLGEAVLTNVSTLNKDAGSLPLKVKEEVQIWSAAHLHLSLIIKHSQSGIIPRHIVLGVQSKVCAQLSLITFFTTSNSRKYLRFTANFGRGRIS